MKIHWVRILIAGLAAEILLLLIFLSFVRLHGRGTASEAIVIGGSFLFMLLGASGRPGISKDVRELIRTMSKNNSLWGAPRIHCELLKLGINVSQATVAKYMVRHPKPPSHAWRTFLKNHTKQLASIDFFTVPTISFRILYVFLVLSHERRRVVHFNVTSHPTAEWTSQQLLHAFPYDSAPRYLIRDRDRIYGLDLQRLLKDMGISQVLTAPRSPWQSPYDY